MTDQMEHQSHDAQHNDAAPIVRPTVRPAKLNLALLALFDELYDEIVAAFPMGEPNSGEHLEQYTAIKSALAAVDAALTALPERADFRATVRQYVGRAFDLTGGDPSCDEYMKHALKRAREDYMPAKSRPAQLGKGSDGEDGPDGAATPDAVPKSSGKRGTK